MDEFFNNILPPGWSVWQTLGAGAVLTFGSIIGRTLIDALAGAVSRARK